MASYCRWSGRGPGHRCAYAEAGRFSAAVRGHSLLRNYFSGNSCRYCECGAERARQPDILGLHRQQLWLVVADRLVVGVLRPGAAPGKSLQLVSLDSVLPSAGSADGGSDYVSELETVGASTLSDNPEPGSAAVLLGLYLHLFCLLLPVHRS